MSFDRCQHERENQAVAVIALGNILRGDDGIAMSVLECLRQEKVDKWICWFPLGTFLTLLPQCLCGHQNVVIIDAMHSGRTPGDLTLLDLSPDTRHAVPVRVRTSHGFSFVDELNTIPPSRLPKRIVFAGIEVAGGDWAEKPSMMLKLSSSSIASEIGKLIDDLHCGCETSGREGGGAH